jgi:Family of unknown function (DUF5681)
MNDDLSGVGYKRPPSRTRFRPGRSGNPAGRPKHRPSFEDTLLSELAKAMPGKDPEQAQSKLQALVKTLVDSAIAGRTSTVVAGGQGNPGRLRGWRAQASRWRDRRGATCRLGPWGVTVGRLMAGRMNATQAT